MTEHHAATAIVTGRVQGVAYRASLERKARSLHLTGWVRNLTDGSVQFMAQGEPEALRQLLSWAATGPAHAGVTAVEVADSPVDPTVTAFEIRY